MTTLDRPRSGPATGEALCAPWLLDDQEYEALRCHTNVVMAWVGDPVLRETLSAFGEWLAPFTTKTKLVDMVVAEPQIGHWYTDLDFVTRRPVVWIQTIRAERALDDDIVEELPLAVEAVRQVQDWLGFSLKQVLKAADIKPRTYHAWREKLVHRPRISSEGRLWRLHQFAEDLIEEKGRAGIRRWFAEHPKSADLLLKGQFDEVAAAAYAGESAGEAMQWSGGRDEHENRLEIPKRPVGGLKMNPGDVAGLEE